MQGAGIASSRNWLGGGNTVELRRRNRLDGFGDGNERVFYPPSDLFDLTGLDKVAADKLTDTALVVPSTVQPYMPFTISWEVPGPHDALARVKSFQLNVFSFGPILSLPVNIELTSEGNKAKGSKISSMWQSGRVELWAHFGSGIRELKAVEVAVDTSGCTEERQSLLVLKRYLEVDATKTFLERVQEEAGEDVAIKVVNDAFATVSSDGFTYHMDIELVAPEGTLTVGLGMQFMIVPRAGNLGASFSYPRYHSVEIDADVPLYADIWFFVTLGEPNLYSYQSHFAAGLQELANGFADSIGRNVRGLPDPDDPNYDTLEAQAPKAVAAAIDMASDQLIVTLCPMTRGLVSVSGIFPADTIKLDL